MVRIVCTIADKAYFPLALDCLASVRRFDRQQELALLDVGLTQEQSDFLTSRGVQVAKAGWNFPFAAPMPVDQRLLSMLSRPFLPHYFPQASEIVYLDADSWVQHASAVSDMAEAARLADLALVPELYHGYVQVYYPTTPLKRIQIDAFEAYYGPADFLKAGCPQFNSGVFAAKASSPVWRAWQEVLGEAVRKSFQRIGTIGVLTFIDAQENHFIEQNALNVCLQRGQAKPYPLGPGYNFVCSLATPLFDPRSSLITEPLAPWEPLRIIHLTEKGRDAAGLMDRQGNRHDRGWRYQGPPL